MAAMHHALLLAMPEQMRYSQEGRGAVFSTIDRKELCRSRITGRASRLPRYFRFALRSLRELTLTPVQPGDYISAEEARAEPPWTSPRIHLSDRSFGDSWRTDLEFNRVQDMISTNTFRVVSEVHVERFIRGAFTIDGNSVVTRTTTDIDGHRRRQFISIRRLLNQWKRFITDVGEDTLALAGWQRKPREARYSESAQKMMAQMGWTEGEGIGKREDGISEPVEAGIGQTSRRGLGFGARKATRDKTEGAAVLYGIETEEGIKYGTMGERNGQTVLEVKKVEGVRNLVRSKETVAVGYPEELRPALLWEGLPIGIAETTFPHPKGWKVDGSAPGDTLERMTVRKLTALFRLRKERPPNCEAKWEAVLGKPVPWHLVWHRLCSP